MRKLLLKRIETMKIASQNFHKDTTRWRNFMVGDKHISEVVFDRLADKTLLELFERLVRRWYTQM